VSFVSLGKGSLARQVLARDVAYELIPFSQRRALHAELARTLEEDGRSGCVPATILAYHWTHSCAGVEAGEWRRALQVPCMLLPSRVSFWHVLAIADMWMCPVFGHMV
jgi:hypothetical protein